MALQDIEELSPEEKRILVGFLRDKSPKVSKSVRYRLQDLELVENNALTERGWIAAQIVEALIL